MRVQTRALVWSETLIRYHRLSCSLIEFEPAQIILESRWEFSLVWPTLHDSRWELTKTFLRANSHQLSSSFGRALMFWLNIKNRKLFEAFWTKMYKNSTCSPDWNLFFFYLIRLNRTEEDKRMLYHKAASRKPTQTTNQPVGLSKPNPSTRQAWSLQPFKMWLYELNSYWLTSGRMFSLWPAI